MKILIEAGADLNQRNASVNIYNKQGYSALAHAAQNGNRELVKLLIDAGAEVEKPGELNSPINLATMFGHTECLKDLLAAHHNKPDHGASPQNASTVVDLNSLKESITASSHKNVKTEEPLITAILLGQAESVEELLKSGTDVEYHR